MYENDSYGAGEIIIVLLKYVPVCVLFSICWRLPDTNKLYGKLSRSPQLHFTTARDFCNWQFSSKPAKKELRKN